MPWIKRTIRISVLLLSAISGSVGAVLAFLGATGGMKTNFGFDWSTLSLAMIVFVGALIGFWAVWFFYWFAPHLFIEVPDEEPKTKNPAP